jgi:hypothetical protein
MADLVEDNFNADTNENSYSRGRKVQSTNDHADEIQML